MLDKINNCKDYIYFAPGIMCCMKIENEGIRVGETTNACDYYESKNKIK